MNVLVRPTRALDAPAVWSLWEEGNRAQEGAALIYRLGTPETFRAHLEAGNVFVAECDEPIGLLGFICVSEGEPGETRIQIISYLGVRADMRGEGIGRRLVAYAKKIAGEREAQALMVIDRSESRRSPLYAEAGFRGIGELMECAL